MIPRLAKEMVRENVSFLKSLQRDRVMPEQEEKRVIVKLAYNYFQEEKWDRALEEYKKLIAIDPMDFLVHNMMAEIYVRKGEKTSAVNEYIKAANLLRATNNMEKAIQAYNHILRIDQENEEARTRIEEIVRTRMVEADDYVRRGSLKNALEMCERLSLKLPQHSALDEKIEQIETLIRNNQQNPQAARESATNTVGGFGAETDNKEKAEEPTESVKNEEVVKNLLTMAGHYESKQAYDKAVETYITIIRFQPGNAEAQNKLKHIYRLLTQNEKFREVWDRITSEQKKPIEHAKQVGKTKPKSNEESAAAHLLNQAGKEDVFGMKERSVTDLENLSKKAEERLRLAVQDRRDRDKRNTPAAPDDYPQAEAIPPAVEAHDEREQSIQVFLTQAQMYIHQNMLIEAMRLAQNILELDPQNKDVRNILKQIYDKKNL